MRNILCFLCVVAFSYYKDGGGGENRTHVLLGCQKTFYILSLPFFLKNGCGQTRRRFRTGFFYLTATSRSRRKIFPPFFTPRLLPTEGRKPTIRLKTKLCR